MEFINIDAILDNIKTCNGDEILKLIDELLKLEVFKEALMRVEGYEEKEVKTASNLYDYLTDTYTERRNIQIISEICSDLVVWVKNQKKAQVDNLYKKLDQISCNLEDFLEQKFEDSDIEFLKEVIDGLKATKDPGHFDYNKAGYVYAYIIRFFLVRFNLAQMTLLKILEKHAFPLFSSMVSSIDILSIGSGPAPMLFAFDGFIDLLKLYSEYKIAKSKNVNKKIYEMLNGLQFNTNYCEYSDKFRVFLYRFIRFLKLEKEISTHPIPYHKGLYKNGSQFTKKNLETLKKIIRYKYLRLRGDKPLTLQEEILGLIKTEAFYLDYSEIQKDLENIDIDDELKRLNNNMENLVLKMSTKDFINWSEHQLKYDIIFLNYFLTNEERWKMMQDHNALKDLCYHLKNGGYLIFIGGESKDQMPIFEKINKEMDILKKDIKEFEVKKLFEFDIRNIRDFDHLINLKKCDDRIIRFFVKITNLLKQKTNSDFDFSKWINSVYSEYSEDWTEVENPKNAYWYILSFQRINKFEFVKDKPLKKSEKILYQKPELESYYK